MKILISNKAHAKFMAYIKECSMEMSVLGNVDIFPNDVFRISDVHLPKQECTGATTDMDAQAVNELATDHDDLYAWLHSHVNMTTFWSGTDTNMIQTMAGCEDKKGTPLRDGLCVAIVGNKKGEMRGAIGITQRVKTFFNKEYTYEYTMHDNVTIEIESSLSKAEYDKIKEELKTNVTRPAPAPVAYTPASRYQGYADSVYNDDAYDKAGNYRGNVQSVVERSLSVVGGDPERKARIVTYADIEEMFWDLYAEQKIEPYSTDGQVLADIKKLVADYYREDNFSFEACMETTYIAWIRGLRQQYKIT